MPARPLRGTARFACLQGKALGLSPPRDAWRPSKTAEPAAPDRPDHSSRCRTCFPMTGA
ncbi:TPA: hypothetical protein L5641_001899 [Pseudomonas aeruginosa]|nr:hypothetical protein [Pseudomonas aeruginosa]HBP4960459.1 hypothetical protein [Pseudomonas aeruginosa]HBP5030138.1 hypothetical protein [Pseudomonas aeruginosa]HBP5042960.1 hypothetical protein [Pseudomonas aeruginosa]HBP5145561.1 hypothetical protein [Pseudomonas aeruginosa]